MPVTIHPRQQTIPADIVEGFKTIGVGDIGHIQQWGFMDTAIRPIWRDIRLVGTAITVWMPTQGAALTRQAIQMAAPGDVLVIDRGENTQIACWGGFVSLLAQAAGIAGLVVDGAVTDTMEISDLHWPVYSRAVSGFLGHSPGDDGEINTTVNCGGVPVSPGDLIVGDDDGILVIRPHEAAPLLAACQQRYGHAVNIRQWIRDGKPIAAYPGVTEFLNRASS